MRKLVWLALPIVGSAFIAACGGGESVAVGDPAPEFALNDTAGNSVSLEEYRDGGPALLYFHMAVG